VLGESKGRDEAPRNRERILGIIERELDGPTVVATAGIHGNENAGVRAAERVVARLAREKPQTKGRFVCVAGNLAALRERRRFIDLDLNRQWTPEKVSPLIDEPVDESQPAEHAEQRALIDVIGAEVRSARGRVFFLDMHTSSADGPPFMTVGDTLLNREFSSKFPLPAILGLEEQVDGSLLEFLNNYGLVTLGIEGGQHDSEKSVDRLEAVLWTALVATGFLAAPAVPDLGRQRSLLAAESKGIPRVIEVRHRHAVDTANNFRMEPGFVNFQTVRKGQLLARDSHGDVLCPEDGLILLPLYQGQGDDGYFVGRAVRPFWLTVSSVLRRLRLGRGIRWLPGVRRYHGQPGVLSVNTNVARIYPLDVFHLFGFRKLRREGVYLIVSRRKHDLARPPRIEFP
jgi:succinylglutamate desuccinylase